jgi:hypothetical protein
MAFEYVISGKWLELLKQIVPSLTRAAVLRDAGTPTGIAQLGVIQAVAPALRVEITHVNLRDAAEIEHAITAFAAPRMTVLSLLRAGWRTFIATSSSSLQLNAGCQPFISTGSSSLPVVSSPTDLIWSISSGAPLAMLIESSKAKSPPTSRCKHRLSTRWRSISRPPKCSA